MATLEPTEVGSTFMRQQPFLVKLLLTSIQSKTITFFAIKKVIDCYHVEMGFPIIVSSNIQIFERHDLPKSSHKILQIFQLMLHNNI